MHTTKYLIVGAGMTGDMAAKGIREHDAENAELLEAVRDGIRTALTPRQRQVLVATVLEGVPIDVLAERLDSNRNALYKVLHDARRRLRSHVAAAGFPEANQ